jgi:hypothetical protein
LEALARVTGAVAVEPTDVAEVDEDRIDDDRGDRSNSGEGDVCGVEAE